VPAGQVVVGDSERGQDGGPAAGSGSRDSRVGGARYSRNIHGSPRAAVLPRRALSIYAALDEPL